MRLVRGDNRLEASSSLVLKDELDLVLKMMDVYSAAEVNKKYWLTKTEKLFFTALYFKVKYHPTAKSNGEEVIRYIWEFSPRFAEKRKDFHGKDVHGYVRKLVDKGWIIRVGRRYDKIDLPEFFKGISDGYTFDYNVRFTLNAPDK